MIRAWGDKVRRKVVIAFRLVYVESTLWTVEGGELKSRRVIVLGNS